MNFTHLAAFRAVAASGSVTAASAQLHVSQPALTREIRELEDRLGVALFHRLPRGMQVTEAGAMLMQFASQIFTLADAAEKTLEEFAGLERGTLAVAASRTVGTYLLPKPLDAFRTRFPGIHIDLQISNTESVLNELLAHRCQLGFVEGEFDPLAFDAIPMGHDELVLIAAPSHPMSKKKTLTTDMLARQALVLREPGSGMRAAVEVAYRARSIELHSSMALGSTEAIKQLVLLGGAMSWLSYYSVRSELDQGSLVALPVRGFTIERNFHLIWLKGRILAPSSKAFAEIAVAEIER